MKRSLVPLVVGAVLLSACTSSPEHFAATTPVPNSSSHGSSSPTTASLPALVLRADLSDPAASWERVLVVPFGIGRARLLYRPPSQSAPAEPTAFAVAPDDSVWIADAGNSRLAHFSVTGRFLGESKTPGPPRDLVFSARRMYVLLEEQGGRVAEVRADGTMEPIAVRANGRALRVSELYPDPPGLVVLSGGYADSLGQAQPSGSAGFVRVDGSGSGQIQALPGLPIGRGGTVRVAPSEADPDQDIDVIYLRGGNALVQPIHFKLVARRGPTAGQIAGEFGPANLLPNDGDVAAYVMVSPSRPQDATRYGGGRWLLRMGRSPLLWERLPDPGLPDEGQHRHITLGPDGHLYLMLLTRAGAEIYRRP